MPNWSPLTLAQLQTRSLLGVVESMREQARKRGLPDPWLTIPPQIVSELRGSVGFSGRYRLDADTTAIPASLMLIACKAVVREMKSALGVPLSEDDKTDAAEYLVRLKALNKGEWPVDAPDNAIPSGEAVQSTGPNAQLASAGRRQATSMILGGLL